jgi:lysophospholipase L1-like esterase
MNLAINSRWAFWLPLLLAQGVWVRLTTPRLPEAAGPTSGAIPGLEPTFNLLVIGESTVAGVGVSTHEEALTGQTALALHRLTGRAINWRALGINGATVSDARRRIAPQLRGQNADAAILAFGVNDTLARRSPRQWQNDLQALVETVRGEAGAVRIVLSGVPPLDQFPAFPRRLGAYLGQHARLLDQAAAELAAQLPDVAHAPMNGALQITDFCADRFHPSAAGYATWGEYLSRFVTACI